ncbi:nucleoside triphosphate pyrophosphohydrolase [Veillonella ratti]|uniref:nucleoside triphosphate pyrophosphohydrolase n=1 Tax=Veillonella ratti TaxID=103892 RepID=UPI001F49CCD9|nr:nucleoside triphosphate pyrophosphohydrolase [Veillonella ratti]
MNTANIGPLLVKLNIDVAQGLFIVGADQIEETPFDLTGTLLVTDLVNDETALMNLTDVLKKRFGANSHVDLYGVALSENNSLGKGLPVSDLSTAGASYMTKLEADMGESLTWVLLRRSAEDTVRTSGNASKIDLTSLEGAETEDGYEFTLQPLIDVVAALRAPDGCPWDRLQTHSTLRRYLLEEVYEVLEAIDNQDMANLREELGDVLLQIVFHARLAEEQGLFTVQDIIDDITAKMIRRHPHVFAKATSKELASTQLNWEALKAQEPGHDKKTLLGGISKGLPALLGAQKLQEKAAKVGFDWDTEPPVWAKFEEEIAEFKEAIAEKDYENAELEGGDVLFSLINLLRWYKIGGENALNRTNNKFRQRFAHVERCVKDSGKSWKDFSLEELDLFWESAKVSEQKHSLK